MKARWARYLPLLAVAISCGWFLLEEHRIAGRSGYSLDDAWIYATFARNVANGSGYSFNPGQSVGGATGPLYVFLLAGLYALFHNIIWPAKALGIGALGASSLLVSAGVRRMLPTRPWLAVLAGALVAISPPLVWGSLSGLEFPVYLLLACLGFYFYVRTQWVRTVLFWSAGVWLRPDGIFLAALSLVAKRRPLSRDSILPTVVCIGILGSYFIFNLTVGHSLFPNSVAVKANLGGNLITREWSMFAQQMWLWGLSIRPGRFGLHAPILIPLMLVGAVLALRRWPVITLYAIGFPLAFALSGANAGQNGRYIAYVIPFGIALSCLGIGFVLTRVRHHQWKWGFALTGICVAWQAWVGQIMGEAHGWNVQNINEMHRYVAQKVGRGLSPGDTVAVNDVGAMGFFSGCYVVDLVGLVSPRRPFPENLKLYRPRLLIIFPDWFRRYAVPDPVTGQGVFYDADSEFKYSPVLGIQLRRNTIVSRNTMCVYERMGPLQTGPPEPRLIIR